MVIPRGIKNGTGKPSFLFQDEPWPSFVSPYYNDTHIHLRKVMREFVDKEIMPYCHDWSEAKAIPRSVVKKCGELGILAAISGAATNPSVAHLLPHPLPAGLTMDQFDIFHEFICVDELSRSGSGGKNTTSRIRSFIWSFSSA